MFIQDGAQHANKTKNSLPAFSKKINLLGKNYKSHSHVRDSHSGGLRLTKSQHFIHKKILHFPVEFQNIHVDLVKKPLGHR